MKVLLYKSAEIGAFIVSKGSDQLKIIFKDTEKNTELVLPITPPSFEVSSGINMETINIHTLGDIAIAGYETAPKYTIECVFPAQPYPFSHSTEIAPYEYVKKFEDWCQNHTVLRYIISDTTINIPVLISDITYGERDGTGDVYATISMQKYRELQVTQTQSTSTQNQSRGSEKTTVPIQTHTVQPGDTLSAICRKYYGNANLYHQLAKYNGIKNPHLIYPGNIIKLPDKSLL